MLNLIKPVAKEIVFTASHLERGFSAKELGGVEEDCESAYEKILAQLKDDQVLVVTGSHFLIAKIISGNCNIFSLTAMIRRNIGNNGSRVALSFFNKKFNTVAV